MRLLERESQLGALREYADEARRGDGRLVLVSGEAGIGKSSLVEAFLADAARRARCLGRLRRALHAAALGPLHDVADQWAAPCGSRAPRRPRDDAVRRAAVDAPRAR